MSTTTIHHRSRVTVTRRPAVDVMAEKLARHLLAWTTRRQTHSQPNHERMALIRENEQFRVWAGSPFWH